MKCRTTSESLISQLKKSIVRSRLALGLPDINRDVIDVTASEMEMYLDEGIMQDNFEDVYRKAMRDKTNSYALNYIELNVAYRSLSQQAKAVEPMLCPACVLEAHEPDKPCMVHNPKK